MIAKFVLATKKAPPHKSGRGANLHSAVPPEFSAQSQHSDRRITVSFRIGLIAYAFARSAPKGSARFEGYAPLSARGALCKKPVSQIGCLYHRILHYIIACFFVFCKGFFKKRVKINHFLFPYYK